MELLKFKSDAKLILSDTSSGRPVRLTLLKRYKNRYTNLFESELENGITMAKLGLNLAIKLVDKFDGDQSKISTFLESIDYLRSTYPNETEQNIVNFLKIRSIGPAHGAINTATTIVAAKNLLKQIWGKNHTTSHPE